VYTAPRKSFLNKGYYQDSCEFIGYGEKRLHATFCTGVIVCYTPSLVAQTALLGLYRQYLRHFQKVERHGFGPHRRPGGASWLIKPAQACPAKTVAARHGRSSTH